MDDVPRLSGKEPPLGLALPVRRFTHPVAWPPVALSSESRGIDGRLVLSQLDPGECRERHRARLSLAAPLGSIGEDLKQLGPKRGSALKTVDALEHTDPGLLDDFLCYRPIRDEH